MIRQNAPMTTTIRRIVPDDYEDYVALRREMLLDTPWAFGASPGMDVGSDVGQLAERLGQPQNVVLGAFSTDGLLSVAGLVRGNRPKTRHRADVWGVYTRPTARRRGLSRAVLEEAIALARSWSTADDPVVRIGLSVSSHSPAARRLYESLGFVVWGTEPDALRVDGELFDEIHLALAL